MSEELTIEKLMGLMPKAFVPEKAAGIDAVIQYNLTGEQGGDQLIVIVDINLFDLTVARLGIEIQQTVFIVTGQAAAWQVFQPLGVAGQNDTQGTARSFVPGLHAWCGIIAAAGQQREAQEGEEKQL